MRGTASSNVVHGPTIQYTVPAVRPSTTEPRSAVGIVLAAAGVLVERRDGRDGELLAWASAAKPAVLRLELREARFSRGGDAAAARC